MAPLTTPSDAVMLAVILVGRLGALDRRPPSLSGQALDRVAALNRHGHAADSAKAATESSYGPFLADCGAVQPLPWTLPQQSCPTGLDRFWSQSVRCPDGMAAELTP
jgi:hypothetical protein